MKDAYYFSHDSNAKDDPKSMLLIDQLGLEGYGIFWVLIETLRDQPDYKYPLKLVPILAKRFNTSAEKMLLVVQNYDFFKFDDKDFFYSDSLNGRMKKLENMREQRRLAGIASGKARKQKALNGRSTDVKQPSNENEQSIVEKSKVNKNIEYYKKQIENNKGSEFINEYTIFFKILTGENKAEMMMTELLKLQFQVSYKVFEDLLKESKKRNKKLTGILLKASNDDRYSKGKRSLPIILYTWLETEF